MLKYIPKTIDDPVNEMESLFSSNPSLMDYIGAGGPCLLAEIQQKRKYELQQGDSPADDCLHFILKKTPPEGVKLPTETQGGFRIFYTGFENGQKVELP